MSDTFLSPDEVADLTGIRTGKHGRTREQLQADWLRSSGIPHWVNARGRPIIARAAIIGRESKESLPKQKWQPKLVTSG